ncbi:MAG: Cytochrome c-type biosis protein CcmF, partial [Belnapia sp.]|nr:Cytochrome c-type biosis protein CcmF [Belnapia sp.]
MIPEIGHFALALALALALAQVVTGLVGAHRADARLMGATGPLAAGVL